MVALVCEIFSFQQKVKRKILTYQCVAALLFAVHFVLLGGYTGALLNIIASVRSYVFMNENKKKIWLPIFLSLYIVSGILTCDGDLNLTTWNFDFSSPPSYICFFPVAGMIFTTLAGWMKKPFLIRVISSGSSPCWIIYNYYNKSYPGILTEVFVLTSIFIGIIKLDIPKMRNMKNQLEKIPK